MSKDEAMAKFADLVRQYGLQWSACQNIPKNAWDAMAAVNSVLTTEDRRKALGLPV